MPDASSYRDMPLDWGDAFERMPLDTPTASVWPAMSSALREHHARRTRMGRLAMAAGVAAVVAVPVLVLRVDRASVPPAAVERIASTSVADPSRATTVRGSASPGEVAAQVDVRVAEGPELSPETRSAQAREPQRALAAVSQPTRARALVATQSPAASASDTTQIAAVDEDLTSLASLQTQSAQLERLLALARDERVASGVTVSLRDAQLDRIASIDAALIEDVDPAQRSELWQARVDALRDATAFEGNRRWREARGISMDAALVRVD